jgi:hypothetical protein
MSRSGSFSNFWRVLSRASELTIGFSGHTPGVPLLSFQYLRAVAIRPRPQPNPALPQRHGAPGHLTGKGGDDVEEASGDSMPAGRPCSHRPRALFKGAPRTHSPPCFVSTPGGSPAHTSRRRAFLPGWSVRIGEYFKPVLPRGGDQRDARGLTRPHRADTATITETPMTAVFCTISIETRLLSSTNPLSAAIPSRAKAPATCRARYAGRSPRVRSSPARGGKIRRHAPTVNASGR